MKSLFPIPLRSFRFSLLLYLLVIGAIPLIIAALIFYQLTSNYIGHEQELSLDQAHEQTIQLLLKKLKEMEQTAKNISLDFGVQQYIAASANNSSSKQKELQTYLNDLLSRQAQQDHDIYAICIFIDSESVIRCSPGESNQTMDEKLFAGSYQLFSPLHLNNLGQEFYGIRYDESIEEITSGVARGKITVFLNLSSLLNNPNNSKSETQLLLKDSAGLILFNKAKYQNVGVDETLVSDKTISYGNLIWYSHMAINHTFSSTSLFLFRNVILVTLGFIVLVSLLSSLIFSHYLMKPLLHLRGLMKRAELGDLKAYWVWDSKQEMNELGYSYNQMLNRIEDLIKQVKQEEGLKKDAEIEALQYQLNPHFLYNTLNTIKWVAKIHKTPQISEVITALVLLLQSSLGKRGDFISLQEEVKLVEAYMSIQFFRYGDDIEIVFELDDFSKTCLVPRMILQPLVENAILHGIKPLKGKGIITIKAWQDRDLLLCQVTDNGIGMPEHLLNVDDEAGFEKKAARAFPTQPNSMKERMSGIGLRHIREKIRLYYGADYKMHIFSKEQQGTTVRISLPIHRNEEYRIEEMR
jgi:sensor histidine kinase YesM